MALYTKRSGAWVPTDGEAISLEHSAKYHELGTSGHTVGWDPGLEGAFTGGGWNHNGFLGGHSGVGVEVPGPPAEDYHPWSKDFGADLLLDCADTGPFGYRPNLWGVFQLGVRKPGLWAVSVSGTWEPGTVAPLFLRAETNTTAITVSDGTFSPFTQVGGYAYPVVAGSRPATLTLTFSQVFTASGAGAYLGLRGCVSATANTTQRIKNIQVVLHWLAHAYAS